MYYRSSEFHAHILNSLFKKLLKTCENFSKILCFLAMSEPLKFLNTDFIRVVGKNMANTPIAVTRPDLGSVLEVSGKFQFLKFQILKIIRKNPT